MLRFKLPAFWRALLVIAAAWLIFEHAFPPLLPRSLLLQYLAVTIIGVLLYYASDDARWAEFKAPIRSLLYDDSKAPLRRGLLVMVPLATAYATYVSLQPDMEAPLELRQMHPAPPAAFQAFGRRYELAGLENPLRGEILKTMAQDPQAGWARYEAAVSAGRDLYYRNCFYCHGDLLDGRGHYAAGLNPRPVSFQDPTLIPQLEESYLFWRIATGGPGLPREGAPWDSAMPVWHTLLQEADVWKLLLFIFDYNGQVPRIWEAERSRAVSAMRDEVLARRARMDGPALYRLRCAVCHGEQGLGDGVAADYQYPRPRDFSLGLFKYKSSPGTLPPRDEDLFAVIKHGLPGTAMPGWAAVMTDAQIRSLILVIKGFDITRSWAPEDAPEEAFDEAGRYTGQDFRVVADEEPLSGRIEYSSDSLARGREAYLKACEQCHGAAGRGNITSGKRLTDDWGHRIWPRDLTKPWSWRGTRADQTRDEIIETIYRRISIGIPGTPMPAHRATEAGNADPVSQADRWHITNYVYSLGEGVAAPGGGNVIRGERLSGELPASVDDPHWDEVPAVALPLLPNLIQGERLYDPLNDALSVRVLYNDREIAFLLELNDRTRSLPGDPYFSELMDGAKGELRPDACAIQFPKPSAFQTEPAVLKPLLRHGDSAHPVTLWYWNAGAGGRVLDAAGLDRRPVPRSTDQALITGGEWRDGRWRVLMKGPRTGDLGFESGRFIPVSFASWDGSNAEQGSRHSLTGWYWLHLSVPLEPLLRYGIPVGVGLVVFALLWLAVAGCRFPVVERKPSIGNWQP